MSKVTEKFTYGYYVLTALKKGDNLKTREEDYIAAGTVNWVSQVSFSPTMVSVAVGQKSDLNETIDYSEHFTIHLLADDQKDYVSKFAKESVIKDGKINGAPFKKQDGQAIIENTPGYITCKVVNSMNVGDHRIYFGEVINEKMNNDHQPLCTMQLPSEYTEENAEV